MTRQAATLLEALPYIQRFAGATFVVKYGGSFMDSPDEVVRTGVARDVVFLEAVEINPVVVHGGGKRISRALEAAGVETRFVNGLRYTDAESVQVVDRVLSQEINTEIVEMINSLGGEAKGSLLALLIEKGWAEGLVAGAGDAEDDYSIFEVRVACTPLGMEKWEHVVSHVFGAIRAMKKGLGNAAEAARTR